MDDSPEEKPETRPGITPGIDALPLPSPLPVPDLGYFGGASADRRAVPVPWYDGSGTEKRLRVKGLVDLPEPVRPELPTDGPDPGKVDEINREVRRAMAEEDDRKLGKIFEDLMESAHASESVARNVPNDPVEQMNLAWQDFEVALLAELRTFCEQARGWGAAYRFSDGAELAIRFKTPENHEYDVTVDMRALTSALFLGKIPKFARPVRRDPREAAGIIVGRCVHEARTARAAGV